MSWNRMRLEIMTPEKKVVSEAVDKVVAEARNGSFGLKPRHIDFLSELVPGILIYWIAEEEYLVAVDSGILVKQSDRVLVSVHRAVKGTQLEELEMLVNKEFRILDQKERDTQIALEHLQADFVKRFVELQKHR